MNRCSMTLDIYFDSLPDISFEKPTTVPFSFLELFVNRFVLKSHLCTDFSEVISSTQEEKVLLKDYTGEVRSETKKTHLLRENEANVKKLKRKVRGNT